MEFGGQFLGSIECQHSLRSDPWETDGQIESGLELEGKYCETLVFQFPPSPMILICFFAFLKKVFIGVQLIYNIY